MQCQDFAHPFQTTPGLATESVGSSSPLSAPPETPPHEGSEPKSTLKSSNSGKKLKRAPANNKGSQRGYLRKHRVSATKSTSKSGNKKKTGGRMVNASTNKQITPTEHSSLFVNPGSAVIDGPFTAYPRQMPVPVEPIDENLRNNPYLKNILMKPGNMEVEELLSRNSQGPTHESTTPVSAALCSQVSILTNPAPTYGSFMLPTIEELQELNAFLQSKFDSLVDEKNEAGIVLCGRERDKLFNRTARVPKLFIETRLKGIDGFKNECVAWDTAMNHRQILQRRDFFKDKMVEVERMMERVSKQQQNGLGGA
ncbi:hypothetical protein UCRPC4_g00268 [Phaeomoniella chlamydospora]|uniref:Uncharacterized protein n=1 Tax=Phaeomoniella chlamydospora TaxID=158046 RepID=A0A0G2F493_PHACM|nr:hypothetical protein UCRPC4_g00268 [Phaeomoniella chlamydospora]